MTRSEARGWLAFGSRSGTVLAEQDAENGIAAQLVMVDEVLRAPRQAEYALRDQGLHFMQHVGAMAPVAKAGGEAIDESNGLAVFQSSSAPASEETMRHRNPRPPGPCPPSKINLASGSYLESE
jgi:hypothetical protein